MSTDRSDFTQGSILKKLSLFMLPVLGALILQAAYGAVDLLVVGRFGSTAGLSAVSTGSQILNLVTFVVTQLAMGVTVLIARYLGEKRPEQISAVLGGAAVVFTILSVGIFILLVGFARPVSVLMQAPEEAVGLTASYVRICGCGIFFIVCYNLLSAIFRGLGDSRSPLIFVLVACIVVWTLFTLVAGGAVRLGYARFNLNLADGKAAAVSDLFSQKDRLWDGFCLKFLQGLYVALWSLLLVIPGIVKSYSYAMAPYIMAEHPALTANEAITESRRIMDGNKWRLFCLDFSFIGWELLCSLPLYAGGFLVLKYFTGSEAMAISLFLLLTIPLSIGFFFVRPYEEAAWATFYRDITAAPTEPDEAY